MTLERMIPMNRRITAALLSAVLLLSLAGCGAKTEETIMDTTVTVATAPAAQGSLSSQSSYIGTVSAEGTAYVVNLVSGRVEEIGVSVGDTVRAGDLLCRIDDESARLTLANARAAYGSAQSAVNTAQSNVATAEASVKSAQAAVTAAEESFRSSQAQYGASNENDALPVIEEQVRLAEDNYNNTKALFDIGAVSQVEVDQAYQTMISAQAGLEAAKAGLSAGQSSLEQARAGIEQAQANAETARSNVSSAQAAVAQAQVGIDSAEYQLTLYNITAPISGVVEAVNVTENNFAASGSAAFVISNGDNKTVTFYVTEQVRRSLLLGQAVTVAQGGKKYAGTITEIGGVVDASAGQFKVKAIIEGADDLPDGLAVELSTVTSRAEHAIIVPSDALFFENGDAYVYIAKDGAAVRTPVEVSIYTAENSAVTAGLLEGDEVITTWSANLRDGVAVRTD